MIPMKKQLIGLSICMVLLATIPLAAGMSCVPEETVTTDSEGLVKTFVRGIIMRPRSTGRSVSFGALFVHYRVLGKGTSAVVRFPHRISFDGDFKGILTNHLAFMVVEGEPNVV